MKNAVVLLFVLLSMGCSASVQRAASPTINAASPSPSPTHDPSKDTLPLTADVFARGSLHSFAGGDDHVTLGITNRGRDVSEVVIDAGAWLQEHSIAMGTSAACNVESNPDLITCGPVFAGEQRTYSIKAFPLTAGTFHYKLRFFSRENGRLVPIVDAAGVQVVISLDEEVDPQGRQVQGYVPEPSPTP